jgi:hypothetical protein
LAEVIHPTHNLAVRVITVPSDLHDTLNSTSPVLEFHAKNVGIRRARGDFVLVTNPDILFSTALIDGRSLGSLVAKGISIKTGKFEWRKLFDDKASL